MSFIGSGYIIFGPVWITKFTTWSIKLMESWSFRGTYHIHGFFLFSVTGSFQHTLLICFWLEIVFADVVVWFHIQVTGGGGYTKENVARCWTVETGVLVDTELPNGILVLCLRFSLRKSPFLLYLEFVWMAKFAWLEIEGSSLTFLHNRISSLCFKFRFLNPWNPT